MRALTGSPKQIAWAEKIRKELDIKFTNGIEGLRALGCDKVLIGQAIIVKNQAMDNNDAEDWIEYRSGQMYRLADRVGFIGNLEKHLGWSKEEVKAIGHGIFDKITEYSICATKEFKGED